MLTDLLRVMESDATFIRDNPRLREETKATIQRLRQGIARGGPLNSVQRQSLAKLYSAFAERQQQQGNASGLAKFAEHWTPAVRQAMQPTAARR